MIFLKEQIKNHKKKFFNFLNLFLLFFYASPLYAKSLIDRLKDTGETGAGYEAITNQDTYFAEKIGSFIQIILSFLGVVFLLLMIYGGFLWMTAQGNETQIEKAKKIITHSVVGVVIVMLAYAVTFFAVYSLGKATNFKI